MLAKSPYFAQACRAQFFEASGKRIDLPSEDPEVFSAVLEYLYKGDYTPKLVFDKKRASWSLDDNDGTMNGQSETTVFGHGTGGPILKDTVIYVRMRLASPNAYILTTSSSVLSKPLPSP